MLWTYLCICVQYLYIISVFQNMSFGHLCLFQWWKAHFEIFDYFNVCNLTFTPSVTSKREIHIALSGNPFLPKFQSKCLLYSNRFTACMFVNSALQLKFSAGMFVISSLHWKFSARLLTALYAEDVVQECLWTARYAENLEWVFLSSSLLRKFSASVFVDSVLCGKFSARGFVNCAIHWKFSAGVFLKSAWCWKFNVNVSGLCFTQKI